MKEIVIIVAGGTGNRMQSEMPKQFIEVKGLPILMHTIKRFYKYNNKIEIRLVLPASQFDFWKELVSKHKFNIPLSLYSGGDKRFNSVKNGLKDIDQESLVAIHDGVRPFVSIETIQKGFDSAEANGAAIPVIEVHETLRKVSENSSETVNRKKYKLVQTPQIFKAEIILKAYQQENKDSFTDDASVVEAMNQTIYLFEGNRENIKITTPNDLLVANCYTKFLEM